MGEIIELVKTNLNTFVFLFLVCFLAIVFYLIIRRILDKDRSMAVKRIISQPIENLVKPKNRIEKIDNIAEDIEGAVKKQTKEIKTIKKAVKKPKKSKKQEEFDAEEAIPNEIEKVFNEDRSYNKSEYDSTRKSKNDKK